ncbi:adhesion G-protein coupled receptor D2 isoform X2 [Esox lucius]|uniref:adhesion G-protein coupled receptor D2 isoform X2 n=1 Tax=Esox lucius TaxID=8010 RepID=UPI001476DE73|nr:adhesion G-protein coupled receptor D2 isoform X2 [Esox lucius]
MRWFAIIYTNVLVWYHHCTSDMAFTVETRTLFTYNESYYKHVSNRMSWHEAESLCKQRSGALATVSNVTERRELTLFLKSQNITKPVWISWNAETHLKNSAENLVLEFVGRSDVKNARLLHSFTTMSAVTVCVRVRFDPTCDGFSTIFSYSNQSHFNEFQLRANLTLGHPVQLALGVHGTYGPYQNAFPHNGFWHSVCVSWSCVGRWALYADGQLVKRGDELYSASRLGSNGVFILGQYQKMFGSSFQSMESFSGSLTQLHIWERVLNDCEIRTMETECSPVLSGLAFRWNATALKVESSVIRLYGDSLCQVTSPINRNESDSQFLYHNFSPEVSYEPQARNCVTFDPLNGIYGLDDCGRQRGAVCQFDKKGLDSFRFPKTALFTKLSRDPLARTVMENMSVDASSRRYLALPSGLTQVLLEVLEASPALLTSADVLYLTEKMKVGATANTPLVSRAQGGSSAVEVMVSITTDYLKLASLILSPKMAAQWLDWTGQPMNVGPFTVVESIDKLTEALADVLSSEGRNFTLSTENIDVCVEARKLSQMTRSRVFQPPPSASPRSGNGPDQMVIPDAEVQKLQALGYEDVMLIHTYYGHLVEIQSRMGQDTPLDHQSSYTSVFPGRLATAVISTTVRDPSQAQNIPVAVNYTLSSHLVEYSRRVTPVCVFWNFTLTGSTNGWSSEGCRVTRTGSDITSCFCNHTTNFAVLMNYMESMWSPEEEVILTKMTFISSGVSLCALLVTLMLFTVLDIPKSDRTSVHRNLFVALACSQVVLLFSGSAVNSKVACTLVATMLHLFLTAAFCWMLVEGMLLWSKVVTVNLSEEQHMKYYYLIGWGLPVLVVTVTLASASGRYSADGHCWLRVQNGVIWGFAGPVIFIIAVNILVLMRVVVITVSTAKRRSIMQPVASSPTKQAYEQIRAAVKAVLVLLPVLGLTWLCGVLVPFSTAMAYVFILLNSLQGLFIFLIYGVCNTEVRSAVNRIKERRKAQNFSNCGISRPSSSVTSYKPSSTPTPPPTSPRGSIPGEEGDKISSYQPSSLPEPTSPHHTLCLEENSSRGQLSMHCVPERLQECPSHATGGLIPRTIFSWVVGPLDRCEVCTAVGTWLFLSEARRGLKLNT